ncbi:oligosaccharide flippase family protein [Arthrobacter sp. UYEF21]|uniref:oligosaccharide flippase family protein n=1 Tax=Arthrobacter sp. UYEF21 TaxID=1756364 RepID=UPI003397422E
MTSTKRSFRGNVLGLLAGQITRLALQAGYFIILARMLGATGYGAFATAIALCALVTPFSSLGTNTIMLRNVSRDVSSASREWARALTYTLLGGAALSGVLVLMADIIAPPELSRFAILQIALAELIGLKLVELTGAVWQGQDRSRPLIVLPTLLNFIRLVAAGAMFLWVGQTTLEVWATVYVLATLPLGIGVAIHTSAKLGPGGRALRLRVVEVKEGLLFSVAMSSQNVYNDIDKAMLARLDSVGAAGVYSAAFRIIDMAYAPIRSISAAAYPLYFREGEGGLASALRLTRRIAPAVLIVGGLAAIGSFFLAPVAPMLLGNDYDSAIVVIQVLAPLVILRGLTFLGADTLTGCGRQGFRTGAQVTVAIFNVGINLVLIPPMGISGAILSTLLCEFILASGLWSYIWVVSNENRRQKPQELAAQEVSGR